MPIVGTAGHVDHGKSTLVEALTGRDPDRWAEEKERGLTIDLGFAWAELTPGTTAGFVDVPGHERFMKNMLAGVEALDVSLFVVAADEGWMPQTEEHLSVLDLLDVRHGVIALTRADLVDADTLELAELEIDERIEGTTLAGWPVVPVSAITGLGLDDIRRALVAALAGAGQPADAGRPRLWVDRSFLIAGAGVVVTGTLTGGSVTRGDTLALHPGSRPVRVRGLQSHEHEVETAHPGTRTAMNLAGVEREQIARGALISGTGQIRATSHFLADLRTVRSYEEGLDARGAFHIHLGSGAWPVHLQPVETDGIAHRGPALIASEARLPISMGDRFILREVGRRAVIAGGRVLDPAPGGRLRELAGRAALLLAAISGSADTQAQALLEARGTATLEELAADSGGGRPTEAVLSGATAVTPEAAGSLIEALTLRVTSYQEANPLRPGAPKASLVTGLGISAELLDTIVARTNHLHDEGATIRTAAFSGALGPAERAEWERARAQLLESNLAVPRTSQLDLDPELFHALVRSGLLERIADDLVYLPEQIENILERLEGLEDGFTVGDFRDALGISRRQAVPLLEWLDLRGRTVRRGDVRDLRKPRGQAGSDAPFR